MSHSQTNGFHSNSHMDEEFEEIAIEVPWGHIAGKWWGARDVQPILAIHGWQDNAGSFDALAPLLIGPNVSILSIDLPGHGMSSHHPKGQPYYIYWDGLIHTRRIVKHFKWEKVSIMGHSLGGGIGFMYASIFPNEVDKLISLDLVCPPLGEAVNSFEQKVELFLKYESLHHSCNPQYEYDKMINITVHGYEDQLTRKSCKILMKRGMKPTRENTSIYRFCRDPVLKSVITMFSLEQVCAFAVQITCKVLNIKALDCIQATYYDTVLDKIRTNAQVDYHRVSGNHFVHLNNPERVSGIISKFLKS
ncbi:hypothetical protein RI129_009787 [Pyrocoelia pectoralis]|uniref:AB hydrolase-1 domain-containing protein n=1 Tax=Pyrocoelia pectoralis TaxID=417401 RepID=A0AAN7ZCK5_9COLE